MDDLLKNTNSFNGFKLKSSKKSLKASKYSYETHFALIYLESIITKHPKNYFLVCTQRTEKPKFLGLFIKLKAIDLDVIYHT